jgi:hypothetical protein
LGNAAIELYGLGEIWDTRVMLLLNSSHLSQNMGYRSMGYMCSSQANIATQQEGTSIEGNQVQEGPLPYIQRVWVQGEGTYRRPIRYWPTF